MENIELKIKYMTDIKPITVSDNGDWIDLRAAIDTDLNFLEFQYIPLGICMELPKGYSAIIAPRSSTYKKWGIVVANSIGIIDESYNGDHDEWHLPVIALRHTHIYKNDRICQFRIIKKSPEIDFVTVKTLGNKNRGGLGSTGEN